MVYPVNFTPSAEVCTSSPNQTILLPLGQTHRTLSGVY